MDQGTGCVLWYSYVRFAKDSSRIGHVRLSRLVKDMIRFLTGRVLRCDRRLNHSIRSL